MDGAGKAPAAEKPGLGQSGPPAAVHTLRLLGSPAPRSSPISRHPGAAPASRFSLPPSRFCAPRPRFCAARPRFCAPRPRFCAPQERVSARQNRFSGTPSRFCDAPSRCAVPQSRFSTMRERFCAPQNRFSTAQSRFCAAQSRFCAAQSRFSTAQSRFCAPQSRFCAPQSRFCEAQNLDRRPKLSLFDHFYLCRAAENPVIVTFEPRSKPPAVVGRAYSRAGCRPHPRLAGTLAPPASFGHRPFALFR